MLWREGRVRGGETSFHCRALGHGDEVALLLHGWPEDGSAWRAVAPLLADTGMRVVAPDLKGFGRSDAPRRGYDPETLADEVAQLIRNLHARKVVLVGHDWGGAVALATAFRHPGMVRSLVLVSAPYRQIDLRTAWHIPLFNLPVLPELAFRVAAERLVRGALSYAARVQEPFTDEVVAEYATAIAATPRGWLAYYRGLSRRAVVDVTVSLARRTLPFLRSPAGHPPLRVPATVVWGEQDPVTTLELGRGVARDLGAEFVGLPGVGHFPPEEDPRGVAAAVLAAARLAA